MTLEWAGRGQEVNYGINTGSSKCEPYMPTRTLIRAQGFQMASYIPLESIPELQGRSLCENNVRCWDVQ